ncbi:MAG TPA: hypothetical protein VFZ18_15385 [Longimicrobiaceae bacterium]
MNAQIRAVRAAERQLRGFPAAVAAILGADRVAARFEPPLDWAEAAPLGALGAATVSGAAREGAAAERPRKAPPEPGRGGTQGRGVADVAGGALAGVRRAVEGIGEVVARGAATAGAKPEVAVGGSGARRAAEGIGTAVAGGARPTLAEALAGGGGTGGDATQPVFSLGAIGKRAAAALSPEAGAGRRGGAPEAAAGQGLAAALGGGPPPGSGGVAAEVGAAVAVAGVQAAGAAATVVEALVPAMAGISRRIEAADARAAVARAAEAAAAGEATGVGGERSRLAAMAAAATRAFADLAPAELASGRAPTLEGQVEPAPAAPAATVAGSPGAAPQVVDAEWVIAVVGDALLEQARRQGIDLT